MMSEKRFVKDHSYLVNYDKYCILDKLQHKHLYLDEVVGLLNFQNTQIKVLKELLNKLDDKNKQLREENEQLKQKLENLGLNEKNDMVKMVEYSIEDFFRWLQRIKKEFEDFEDRGF